MGYRSLVSKKKFFHSGFSDFCPDKVFYSGSVERTGKWLTGSGLYLLLDPAVHPHIGHWLYLPDQWQVLPLIKMFGATTI